MHRDLPRDVARAASNLHEHAELVRGRMRVALDERAVDRAIEVLCLHGSSSCVVNAGGDIRVAGDEPERITSGGPLDGAVRSSRIE